MPMPLLVEVAEKALGPPPRCGRPSTEFSLATLTWTSTPASIFRRLLDPELATSRATIVLAL